MQIKELLKNLALAELSNLSISEGENATIKEKSHEGLLLHINEGLLRLYTRFVLSEKSLVIEQLAHITKYPLRKGYSECSGSDIDYKFIKDMPGEPFQEDVIKILSVYDSSGHKRPLNDVEDVESLFTPQPDVLQIPSPIQGQALGVVYQARHAPITKADEGYLDREVEIPFALEGALQSYVASKVFSNMNGPENKATSQGYLTDYERICVEMEDKDIINKSHQTSHSKLEERGFV
jgi:hypothetical protein